MTIEVVEVTPPTPYRFCRECYDPILNENQAVKFTDGMSYIVCKKCLLEALKRLTGLDYAPAVPSSGEYYKAKYASPDDPGFTTSSYSDEMVIDDNNLEVGG